MSPSRSAHSPRRSALAGAALVALGLAGCGGGGGSGSACTGNVCTVETDRAAEVEVEQLGVTVDVSDLRDGRVRLAVDGAAADVAAGRSVDLRGWRLTAETATVDDAKIRVVRAAGG